MKKAWYVITILLSVLPYLLFVVAFGIYTQSRTGPNEFYLKAAIGSLIFAFVTTPFFKALRDKARNRAEYDEFGRNKKRTYQNLSRKERDQIDLEKTKDLERMISSTALKQMTKKGSKNPKEDMDKLIGLSPVKQKMEEMVARMQFDKMNKNKHVDSRHMVFYGSPGTGKTTVARILTGFLYQNGYIKKNKCIEVDGNFLKAGQKTAIKTEYIIQQAYGGVLFIDEAYALAYGKDGSGEEAIATLIKQMEDNRDKFILILAGYTTEMQLLLELNPGFKSRIKEYLMFPDYTSEELFNIFSSMAKAEGYEVHENARKRFYERIQNEQLLDSFGNARTVRNILDDAYDKHAYHYMNGIVGESYKMVIQNIDIPVQPRTF